jgi:hypothetical protein
VDCDLVLELLKKNLTRDPFRTVCEFLDPLQKHPTASSLGKALSPTGSWTSRSPETQLKSRWRRLPTVQCCSRSPVSDRLADIWTPPSIRCRARIQDTSPVPSGRHCMPSPRKTEVRLIMACDLDPYRGLVEKYDKANCFRRSLRRSASRRPQNLIISTALRSRLGGRAMIFSMSAALAGTAVIASSSACAKLTSLATSSNTTSPPRT